MNHEGVGEDLEFELCPPEALLAGTLALMTGHAQAVCDECRAAMSREIVANIDEMLVRRCLSAQFRRVLGHLRAHWHALHRHASVSISPAEGTSDPARRRSLH